MGSEAARDRRTAVIAEANPILRAIYPDLSLQDRSRRLWIVARGDFPAEMAARLNGNGDRLGCDYGRLGMGGTGALATGQLVRWTRGLTRVPLTSWEYWLGPKILLGRGGDARALELLRASSYSDPKLTCCVLCGSPKIADWWNDGKLVGPCCWGGRCRRKGGEDVA
jgi:hypothetical protein